MSKHSLTHALKWSFLSELAAKALQPVVFLALATMLTPDDFGVMSAALMVVTFSQVFWEAGMGKALIQRQTDIDRAANAGFWINMTLGGVVAGVFYLSADFIASRVFQDSRVTLVLQAMTAFVLLGAVASIPYALLQKELSFKKLFWVRFATIGLPGLASIPLAWHGMGHWALVSGTLIGQAVQALLLWRMCAWRPAPSFDPVIAGEMGRFAAWVAASGLLGWFYAWADGLIIGMFLGSHDLGLYRTGNQMAAILFALSFSPVAPVLYSYLSRTAADRAQSTQVVEKLIRILATIAIPLAFIIFSVSGALESALFGDRWQGIAAVIGLMALMHGYSWIVGMNGEFYRAMGKPALETVVTAGSVAFYLAAYLLSVRAGLETFLVTRCALAFGALVVHLLVLRSVIPVRLLPIGRHIAVLTVIALLVTTLVDFALALGSANSWWRLCAGGALNLAALGAVILLLERNGAVRDIAGLIRNRAG